MLVNYTTFSRHPKSHTRTENHHSKSGPFQVSRMVKTGDMLLSVSTTSFFKPSTPLILLLLFPVPPMPPPYYSPSSSTNLYSPCTKTFRQPGPSTRYHQPNPTIPRLPTLPYQVFKGIHALEDETPSGRVLEGPQQGQARGRYSGEKDSDG